MDPSHDRPNVPADAHPLLGTWVRAGERIGLVARVADGQVSVFFPGDRRIATTSVTEVEAVPAGAVRITATVELPLAHGLGEEALRRWAATLLDGTLRERAQEALRQEGLDVGAALPQVRVDVTPAAVQGALCLCGAVTAPAPGTAPTTARAVLGGVRCERCGRAAAPPPAPSDEPGSPVSADGV